MASAKHEKHLHKMQGLVLPKASHPEVRRLKRHYDEPSLHGTKVWRSSAVLMDYLLKHPVKKRGKVVEIGCGWGGLSCFLDKQFQAKVMAVDADEALAPYVELVTSMNSAQRVGFVNKRFEKITKKHLDGVHTLLGSDICFWDEMTKPLFNLIKRAHKAGVKQVMIADPGRPPFLELVDLCEDAFGAEMVGHKIKKPWKTEKYILHCNFKKR